MCNFIIKETPTQMFSCGFCEIFKMYFFNRISPVAASKESKIRNVIMFV